MVLISILCIAITGCSSIKIVKQYNPDGAVKEIKAIENSALKYRIVFGYDQAARISTVSKYLSAESKPSGVRSFSFDSAGKLRIQSHRETHQWDGKTAEDFWVESFFYKNTGELVKIETSYKSSLSMALHKTPLVITQYSYKEGRIDKILISGGIFKKEISIKYKAENPSKIEFSRFLFRNASKKYEQDAHIVFFIKSGKPYKAENIPAGSPAGPKKDLLKVFEEEKIAEELKKPEFTVNISKLLANLESEWMQ